MINRDATFISRLAAFFVVLFALTACGGGGGGPSFYGGDDDNNNQDSSIDFTLLDPQGNETETVTAGSPGTLKVHVKNAGSGVVVSAQTTIGTLFPETGTALTDNDGVATFQLEAGPETGAGVITANATVNDVAVTETFGFQVGDTGLRLGYFDADGTFIENQIAIQPQGTLAGGGNAQLSVVVLNSDGERVSDIKEVRFNSSCIASGDAALVPVNPVRTVNGDASTTYTAMGCAGIDQITASLVGASAQASGSITVASPQANAVNFVTAVPTLIVLRGTGGVNRDETSDVTFQVVDNVGKPLPGISVALSLTTEIGGLSLSPPTAITDGAGQVKATVTAGDVATTVRVIAKVDGGNGETVATASDQLTVTTGLPDQNSISLSVGECDGEEGFVVENGMTVDGKCRTLNVSMADKFNNPVVDGTSAVFTTEYGAIVGACNTLNGGCSVQWRSQEPRIPTLTQTQYIKTINDGNCPCPQDLGEVHGGRSTIVVRAQGEESFVDSNGNGVMDEAEKNLFDNLPEAFIDNNEDGVYTPGLPSCVSSPLGTLQCQSGYEETFFDFNNNGIYDRNDDPAEYNGLLCPPEGDGVWCSRELVEVRDEAVVIMTGSDWFFNLVGDTVYISDVYNNPPAFGSKITFEVSDGCLVNSIPEIEVPLLQEPGAFGVQVATSGGGTVRIKLELVDNAAILSGIIACAAPEPEPEPE